MKFYFKWMEQRAIQMGKDTWVEDWFVMYGIATGRKFALPVFAKKAKP